jgi:hypothetical protein
MNLILGEWREGKVRPIPGNTPHGRPVSRVISCPLWSIATIPATPLDSRSFNEHAGARGVRFWRHGGIYRSDVASKPKPNPSRDRLPPAGRPRPRLKNASGGPRSSHRPR